MIHRTLFFLAIAASMPALSLACNGAQPTPPATPPGATTTAPTSTETAPTSTGTTPSAPTGADTTSSATPSATTSSSAPVLGGDKDAHGCIGSAGYTWCEREKKCVRPWELAKEKGFHAQPAPGDAGYTTLQPELDAYCNGH